MQLGQVELPGDAVWNFDWQTAEYTLTDSTSVTAPQLLSVQTPAGHDAAGADTVADAESRWWVVYDPVLGELQGFVSPLPGIGAAANDRLGRHYTLASGFNPGVAQIAWGQISGSAPNFSLSAGALLQQVRFDDAWRRTSLESVLDDATTYTVTYSWDANTDQQTGTAFAGASQSQSYDFLGRAETLTGPGAAVSTARYDQGNLAGWTATMYDNGTLAAPSVNSEAINSAGVNWTSAPDGVSSSPWSMQLSTYLPAPAAGDSIVYRLSSDSNGSATLWVNGQCDPEGTQIPGSPPHAGQPDVPGPPPHGGKPDVPGPPPHANNPGGTDPGDGTSCGSDNTTTTSVATAEGDALNLVVQYVRDGTAVSAAAPVDIQIEQQVNSGNWTPLTLAGLDPGYDLQSTVTSSDTLSPGGAAVTLTRSTAWANALFGTQAGVTYPGFSGDLSTVPGYESDYDPENSLWQRLISQTSAGGSTYGIGYWDNTATPSSPDCSNTAGVIQAGQVSAYTYPDTGSGAATGLSRRLAYDAAGRKAGLEVIPAGEASGVSGCLSYDGRGRKLAGRIGAYGGNGAMGKTWTYSADGLTTTITHIFENPAQVPACATEASAPYTCSEIQTVDLLGRTVESTDVWGTTAVVNYQLDPATGVQTTTTTLTAGAFTSTATLESNRDGTPASLSRSDDAGSPVLGAVWSYDSFGRTRQIVTESGGSEIITASYGYDDQSRVNALTWTRGGNPMADNRITLAANSSRTLGEAFTIDGVSYDYAYHFNSAGWLIGTDLTSSGALSAAWSYGFESAGLGANPDAYLNGNVTHYGATVGSSSDSLEFGYDYLDRIAADSPGSLISHDGLGNLTGYGGLTLDYNQASQLMEAGDGSLTVSFERTPDGDLIRKVSDDGGSATAIRYAAGNLILDDSGAATHQTVLIGNLLARLDLSAPAQSDFTVTTLQGGNALLSLDETGSPQNLDAPSLYGPWGEAINPPAADPARPSYGWQAGNRLETAAGLVLMGKRAYLPKLGRFTSLDPVYGGGINGYNYANNDPVNNNDPNGKLSLNIHLSNETKQYLILGGIAVIGTGSVICIIKCGRGEADVQIEESPSSGETDFSYSESVGSERTDLFDSVPGEAYDNGIVGSLDDVNLNIFISPQFQRLANKRVYKPSQKADSELDTIFEEGGEAAELL